MAKVQPGFQKSPGSQFHASGNFAEVEGFLRLNFPRTRSFTLKAQEKNQVGKIRVENSLESVFFLNSFFPIKPEGRPKTLPPSLNALIEQIQNGKTLRKAFSSLDSDHQKEIVCRVGNQRLQEIFSICENKDSELFWSEALHFAIRQKQRDQLKEATNLLGYLSQGPEQIPKRIQEKARLEFNSIVGKGEIGYRIEFLGKRFAKDATDYRMIIPMMVASVVFQTVNMAALSRMANSAKSVWYTRGMSARLLAGLAGFAAEVPTFAFSSRGLRQLSGEPVGSMGRELLGIGITLGFLKGFGFLGNQVFLRMHGISEVGMVTRMQGFLRVSCVLFPQASIFLGLLLAQRFEAKVGLRPQVDGATLVTDTLSSLVSLGIGAHLGHRTLGLFWPGFENYQEELGKKAQIYYQAVEKRKEWGLRPAEAMAGLEGSPSLGKARPEIFYPTNHAMMEEGEGFGEKGPSLDNIAYQSPLGTYSRHIYHKIPVYTFLRTKGTLSAEEARTRGLVILIAGGYTNHTSMADLPKALASEGWEVKIPVFPEFERPHDTSKIEGGFLRAHELSKDWQALMPAAIGALMKESLRNNPDLPIFLGGLSLGGAATLLTYGKMSQAAREKVKGLILMAPALNYKVLEKGRVLKPLLRYIALPGLTFLRMRRERKKVPSAPEISDHVEIVTDRPRTADYASVLFSGAAKRSLKNLKNKKDLPPVLVLSAGEKDETVDVSSIELVQKVFPQMATLELANSSHWILGQSNRHKAFDAIKGFLKVERK